MDKSIRRDGDILDSMRDCLADISDIGFLIHCNSQSNIYKARIMSPRALASNHNNRIYPEGIGHLPPNQWGNHFDDQELQDELLNIIDELNRMGAGRNTDPYYSNRREEENYRYDGARTYEKVRNELNFLCSYIPDMYGISLKGIRVEFVNSKYNALIQEDSKLSVEPLYWTKSYNWLGLLQHKCFEGLMHSDIVTIDVQFERELPREVEKWMNDFIKDKNLPKKENWFRRLINRIKF